MNNFFDVLSFDPNKTWMGNNSYGLTVMNKKSKPTEIRQWLAAYNFLESECINVDGIEVGVARLVSYSMETGLIESAFCHGLNMEHELRYTIDPRDRDWYINWFKAFFVECQRKGFLWGELAPRNMIYQKEIKKVILVDFERPMELTGSYVPSPKFSSYLRTYALEEFSCWLYADEQKRLFNDFLVQEDVVCVPFVEINSERKKGLLIHYYGKKEKYTCAEVQRVELVMSKIATPSKLHNNKETFYPMLIMDKKGKEEYVKIVSKIAEFKPIDRYRFLSNGVGVGRIL